jgi:hypothetical protein
MGMKVEILDPRKVSSDDFPSGGPPKAQLRFLLNYAVLAPSGHNAQPWLFRLADDGVELIFNRSRALCIVDPDNREMIISCGAALGNLEVAARYFGYQANIQLGSSLGDPDCLAKVTLSKGAIPTASEIALFEVIRVRQTNRSPFTSEKISEDVLCQCIETAAAYAVEFSYCSDQKTKSEIAKLTMSADKNQFSKPWYRVELASWMHSNKRDEKDGMSAYRFGLPDVFTPIAGFMIRTFNIGNRVAQNNKKRIEAGSPVLGVFATQSDQKNDWVNTGRALAQVLLVFTSVGFSASYLNQSIEIDSLRKLLRKEFNDSAYPQIMLRIGRADTAAFSVRRAVDDCLI